jgi:hypothetical protein
MPNLQIRNASEVPSPNRTSKSVHEAQLQYEGFIQAIDGNVGELELSPDEQVRSVKVRLRRAATRLSREIEIWDVDGRVYFSVASRRGRPRKAGRPQQPPLS